MDQWWIECMQEKEINLQSREAVRFLKLIGFSFILWILIGTFYSIYIGLVQRTPQRGTGFSLTGAGDAMSVRRGVQCTCKASTPNRSCSLGLGRQPNG